MTNAGEREGNVEAGVFVRLSSAPGATTVASTRVYVRARACFQKSFSLFLSLSPSSSPHPRRGSTSRPREKQTARRKAGERGDTRNLLNHLETVSSSEEKRESSRLIFPARFSARSSVPFFFFFAAYVQRLSDSVCCRTRGQERTRVYHARDRHGPSHSLYYAGTIRTPRCAVCVYSAVSSWC